MTTFIRDLRRDEVQFEASCMEEDDHPENQLEGSALDCVEDRLAQGIAWGWCCAKVTARWGPFEGVAYLGGCSYESKEDFKQCLYYGEMCLEALQDLQDTLGKAAKVLEPLITRESVNEWLVSKVQDE